MAYTSETFTSVGSLLESIAERYGITVLIVRVANTRTIIEACAGPLSEEYPVGNHMLKQHGEQYCERVERTNRELFVKDARVDPDWRNGPDMAVRRPLLSYLGLPTHDHRQRVFGTVCYVDEEPREYSEPEIDALAGLRDAVNTVLGAVGDKARQALLI